MDFLKPGWFTEVSDFWPGTALSLEVKRVLHHEKSAFQDVLVLDTKSHGRVLVLDGLIQCTENDECSYQEAIAFLPLCSHPEPKSVLIVGGGDGGVAREVAKHPDVEKVVQVEIDALVLEVSRKYLPFVSVGLDHPKVTLNVGDGFEFLKNHVGEFDVVITDSCDPIGPAERLFQEPYFQLLKAALKPNGIICSQAGNPWSQIEHVSSTFRLCKSVFPTSAYAVTSVPTYPTGQIGFVLGTSNANGNFKEPVRIFTDQELENMGMRYYSANVHRAAFGLPRFLEKALRN
ncbi:spermidine synthase [Orussus abietinus]|uniref:spermidine synthase n=1 Tax=Orussus abietinus TaxID=222816 RepID=UPI0006258143|nr:spermidine synthase [Orussus abietinus]XP_012276744.1 spermidine synthase [Orussus abietinus]